MKNVVLLGTGKIGRMVAHFLASSGDYSLRVADADETAVEAVARSYPEVAGATIDFSDRRALEALVEGAEAVISCAPFHCNVLIAEVARSLGVHYLDLTEDVRVTRRVAELAEGADSALVPQCGLAPGFITIAANHLLTGLDEVRDVRMRVGALPRFPSNRLKYNLTWSTAGLVNEYLNPCDALIGGEPAVLRPLEGLEHITIDGVEYEAFNTSGGLGTLAETLRGKVRNLTYKTLRYPGHCEWIRFLVDDLGLRDRRELLCELFDRALPTTTDDQVVVYVSVTGTAEGRYVERTYARTIRGREIGGRTWTAIQVTTAAGVCAVLDLLCEGKIPIRGFVRQEQVPYDLFLDNRFGRYYGED